MKMKSFLALTAALAMIGGQLKAEDCNNDCDAYFESGRASYMAALLPIGALIVAAVVIATSDSGHHHHSGSSSSSKSSSSRSSRSSSSSYHSHSRSSSSSRS